MGLSRIKYEQIVDGGTVETQTRAWVRAEVRFLVDHVDHGSTGQPVNHQLHGPLRLNVAWHIPAQYPQVALLVLSSITSVLWTWRKSAHSLTCYSAVEITLIFTWRSRHTGQWAQLALATPS